MKRILDHVEKKKAELAHSPFLRFVSDSNLEPAQRFGFVPCLAPFVMAFMDLNKHVLRKEPSQEPLQRMLNTQSHEEDSHWHMYLKDLRTLGVHHCADLTQALKLLWSEESKRTRLMVYESWRSSSATRIRACAWRWWRPSRVRRMPPSASSARRRPSSRPGQASVCIILG